MDSEHKQLHEINFEELYPSFPGMILRVYIDTENNKYYLDAFAAYKLRFIDYLIASVLVDFQRPYYEISYQTLKRLEKSFYGRIKYIYWEKKEEDKLSDQNEIGYDEFSKYKSPITNIQSNIVSFTDHQVNNHDSSDLKPGDNPDEVGDIFNPGPHGLK